MISRGPFKTVLRRLRGKGGGTCVTIPKKLAPPIRARVGANTGARIAIAFSFEDD